MKPRHQNIVASYLVLKKYDQVLLSQRKNTGYRDGEYSLIAGHLEPGETFTQAIVREAKEEIGIHLDPKKITVSHLQHCKSDNDGSERVNIYFVATKWTGKLHNQEPNKCNNITWFKKDNLPRNIVPHVHDALQNMRKKYFVLRAWMEKFRLNKKSCVTINLE